MSWAFIKCICVGRAKAGCAGLLEDGAHVIDGDTVIAGETTAEPLGGESTKEITGDVVVGEPVFLLFLNTVILHVNILKSMSTLS